MDDRIEFVLISDLVRQNACRAIMKAGDNCRVEIKAPRRTIPQNSRLWAHLNDISRQRVHAGRRLSPSQWKVLFLDALLDETHVVPKLNGIGLVNIGKSSSDLTVKEMADLITLIEAYGAEHGVVFGDELGNTPSFGPSLSARGKNAPDGAEVAETNLSSPDEPYGENDEVAA